MKALTALSLSLIPALILGCGRDAPNEDGTAGPCVHGYAEPALTIQTATSRHSGAAIARLTLRSLTVNGSTISTDEWAYSSMWSRPFFNVAVENNVLYCDVPCGFGTGGRYAFVAEAAGHEAINVSVDARYATFRGGCPSFDDDGTDINLQLSVN